jgi:hypothetical protein
MASGLKALGWLALTAPAWATIITLLLVGHVVESSGHTLRKSGSKMIAWSLVKGAALNYHGHEKGWW